jgi:hypothetical protein
MLLKIWIAIKYVALFLNPKKKVPVIKKKEICCSVFGQWYIGIKAPMTCIIVA